MSAVALDELLGSCAREREREESWRYSKAALRALTQQGFAAAGSDLALPAPILDRIDLPRTRGRRIVFVNGVYAERYSDVSAITSDVAIRHESGRLTLVIAAGCAKPLHLVQASVPAIETSLWRATTSIDVQSGRVELIEQYVGAEGAEVLGVHEVQITLGQQAELEAICWSDLADTLSLLRRETVSVGIDAVFNVTQAHFGGRLQRFESAVDLAGRNATFHARGVFALRGRQHVDVHLDVRHNARDAASDVLWRGVADQRARGILHGAIKVAPGADGADARLQTKNLLLSPHAEIDAQPVLEIYADEVKAAHGATVGQLDETALFYLRSRGLPVATARSLLIAGFCREAFAGIADVDLRGRLDALLVERLPQTAEIAT